MKIVSKHQFRSQTNGVNESPDMVRITIDATRAEARKLERQIQDIKPEGTKSYAVYVVDNRTTKYIIEAESEEEARGIIESADPEDLATEGEGIFSEWYVSEVQVYE